MNRFNDNIKIFFEIGQLKSLVVMSYDIELSFSDIDFLNVVYHYKVDTIKEISHLTHFSPSLITKITKKLYAKGYIKVNYSEEDKRVKYIKLDKQGIQLIENINNELKSFFEKSFSNFKNEDIELFITMVRECHNEFIKMKNMRKGDRR